MFIKNLYIFFRHIITINIVKLSIKTIKFFKLGSGTNLPGKIARKISPDILSYLAKQTKKEIITITGTNGKTTTAGLVSSIFRKHGRKITHNQKGANMLTGVTAAAVSDSRIDGKLDVDNCVFEIDEAYLYPAFDEFNPDIAIVTNLFRDQLDRYGELNTTARKIEAAVEKSIKSRPLKLILNADDPLVSRIMENSNSENLNKIYFGFEKIEHINPEEEVFSPQETVNCKCGQPFRYSKIFYGHLGYYECSCGVKRAKPNLVADACVDINHSELVIKPVDEPEFKVRMNLPGLYNCYNAVAAITIALEAGITPDNIKSGIENFSTTFGRAEYLKVKGKEVLIQLIKNPIGATEVLRTIKNDESGRLFIIINDNYADGRDVSWLWDANFELLSGYNKTAVVSGIRAADMAVRLRYAGINNKNIVVTENIKEAFFQALDGVEKGEKLYVLPTYTALLELEKVKQFL